MDKGPHVIKLSPGGVPPVIHASQYEGGDGATIKLAEGVDLEFLLLSSELTYYTFFPRNDGLSSGTPAKLHYVRPDGYQGEIFLGMSRDNRIQGHSDQSGQTYYFTEPHVIAIKDIPFELTEVAGDVACEIEILRNDSFPRIPHRSENFIIRVEPYPRAIGTPAYSGGNSGDGGGGGADTDIDRNIPAYIGGETVDNSLVSWSEVVEAANEGTLDTLIEPGQEIRAVMLTNGQFMGIRCVHVEDGETAWFESKNLFLAPKQYSPGIGMVYGYIAAQSWAAGIGVSTLTEFGPTLFPHEIRSVAKYFGSPYCYQIFGSPSSQAYNYTNNIYGSGIQTYQFDYYKTTANRIKIIGSGEIKPWITGETDARLEGNKIVTDNIYGVTLNGDLTRHPINDSPDEVYVPVAWRLQGDRSGMRPVDIQSWQDVKNAAARGKLLNSTLHVGQLMPELPTVGVLRCVHITESWAAFDSEMVKGECLPQSALSTLLTTVNSVLTNDEKEIFTVLGKSGNDDVYTQAAGRTNVHLTGGGGVYSYTNTALGNTQFDYYADSSLQENTNEPKRVKSGSYWVYYGGSYKTFISAYGAGQTYNVNNYTTMKHSLNPVFVVGEI